MKSDEKFKFTPNASELPVTIVSRIMLVIMIFSGLEYYYPWIIIAIFIYSSVYLYKVYGLLVLSIRCNCEEIAITDIAYQYITTLEENSA